MARELSLEGRARERFLALPHCQNCSCENLFQEVPCQLKLTPELSRTALRPRRCDNYSTAPRPRSGLGLNELLGLRRFTVKVESWVWAEPTMLDCRQSIKHGGE